MEESSHSPVLATFAVVAGLTLFIPVPFVDDIVRGRVQRRLVRTLGDRRGIVLSDDTVETLSDDGPGSPLLHKVALAAALYPVKKVLRKTFMVLAGKEVVDTVSRTYHLGYMVDVALTNRWHEQRDAATIRAAIDKACEEAGTKPVEGAVKSAYHASRDGLSRLWKKKEAMPESAEVKGLAEKLRGAISGVPHAHFAKLREVASRELGLDDAPPADAVTPPEATESGTS